MLTISKPPIGAIAFGRSGVGHIITALETDRVVLRCPDGLKRVPLDAVIRWELSPSPTTPIPGQQVRLKGTDRTYTLTEIYRVYCGRGSDDQPFYEQWARLQTNEGKPAHWKLSQLTLKYQAKDSNP
jgi:hypothetical protein